MQKCAKQWLKISLGKKAGKEFEDEIVWHQYFKIKRKRKPNTKKKKILTKKFKSLENHIVK